MILWTRDYSRAHLKRTIRVHFIVETDVSLKCNSGRRNGRQERCLKYCFRQHKICWASSERSRPGQNVHLACLIFKNVIARTGLYERISSELFCDYSVIRIRIYDPLYIAVYYRIRARHGVTTRYIRTQ